jgi:signal transduction histidine kinase
MRTDEKPQREKIKMGDPGFVNENCWLAKTLNYPPSKRCRYCKSKFNGCLFFQYLIISLTLVLCLISLSLLIEGRISKLLVISIFVLVVIYGYFFSRSTEKIIEANFSQIKAKEALEELTKNLQQKVEEQTKDIKRGYEVEKKAKEELEKIDQAKNQFLLATQHHLRTPLSVIMGYDDLMLKGIYGKIPKKAEEVIEKIQYQTQNLIKMVNDFLDITQFQLGKSVVVLRPNTEICPMIDSIVEQLKLEAETKGIYIKFEKPKESYTISADLEKLKAALYNIIDNAIKYTNKGGVTIMVTDGDVLKIIVKDTGIGMSEKNINVLFGRVFERGEEAKKAFATGRGIGLYIAGQIIKDHKGKIWAESDGEGKGSVFYIELPRA